MDLDESSDDGNSHLPPTLTNPGKGDPRFTDIFHISPKSSSDESSDESSHGANHNEKGNPPNTNNSSPVIWHEFTDNGNTSEYPVSWHEFSDDGNSSLPPNGIPHKLDFPSPVSWRESSDDGDSSPPPQHTNHDEKGNPPNTDYSSPVSWHEFSDDGNSSLPPQHTIHDENRYPPVSSANEDSDYSCTPSGGDHSPSVQVKTHTPATSLQKYKKPSLIIGDNIDDDEFPTPTKNLDHTFAAKETSEASEVSKPSAKKTKLTKVSKMSSASSNIKNLSYYVETIHAGLPTLPIKLTNLVRDDKRLYERLKDSARHGKSLEALVRFLGITAGRQKKNPIRKRDQEALTCFFGANSL